MMAELVWLNDRRVDGREVTFKSLARGTLRARQSAARAGKSFVRKTEPTLQKLGWRGHL